MGNKLKHEIKSLTYHEIGVKLDDQLEAAKGEKHGYDGAKSALARTKILIENLTANIDVEAKDGALTIEASALAKKWVLRAANVVQNIGIQAEVQAHQAHGKIIALEQAVKVTKTLYEAEKAQLEAESEGEERDPRRPDARPSGQHPGNPLADRREASSAVEGEIEAPSEATPSDPPPADRSTNRPPALRGKKARR